METHHGVQVEGRADPARIWYAPMSLERNRLTTAFRPILAIPHVLLVGGPIFVAAGWGRDDYQWGAGGGVLGAVATVCALIAWFAIVFTGQSPAGLWHLAAFYLRWRVRAAAYASLLCDEYPPFGDGAYPVELQLAPIVRPRNRVTVAFRVILAIPHIVAVCFLGIAWTFTTLCAWVAILFTGRYPAALYTFGAGALLWCTRVEAYLLLMHDEYPPFSLQD